MLDLFQEGTLPALAERAASRNACGEIIAGNYDIHTYIAGDCESRRKSICSKPSTIHCHERRLVTQMHLLSHNNEGHILSAFCGHILRKCIFLFFWTDSGIFLIVLCLAIALIH